MCCNIESWNRSESRANSKIMQLIGVIHKVVKIPKYSNRIQFWLSNTMEYKSNRGWKDNSDSESR